MKSINVLINHNGVLKRFFKIKELKNKDFLYSFSPLDGKIKTLYGEEFKEISVNEKATIVNYDDMVILDKEIDHISLHTNGCHIITSKKNIDNKSNHYGNLLIPNIQNENIIYQIGVLLPPMFSKLPILDRKLNLMKDIVININGNDGFSINLYYLNKPIEIGETFRFEGEQDLVNKLMDNSILAKFKFSTLLLNINILDGLNFPNTHVLTRWTKKRNDENTKIVHISYFG